MGEDVYAELALRCAEQVPVGRVTTYGAIADAVGAVLGRGGPRQVGSVMSRHGSGVPWWRVIRASGRPADCHDGTALEHLHGENVPMRAPGVVDLERAFYQPVLDRADALLED
ncbi:cysteine methyltransferase [Nocardioides seonyuensis]|uniref:Cysteine methyltransferase n=1 Tax=Nocardioides seonyuensis TaxID=2518371 RepID=A0A4V1BMH4_9ACTN|nr:MGMT family protein [Nocardioides seonyuensis]QBX56382.1 cysteine methyltransferase [Nocardioides seonyuensis]